MYQTKIKPLPNDVHRHKIFKGHEPVSYAEALDLWQHDSVFRSFFLSTLADSIFSAYRWETPPITEDTADQPFEFVLIDAPFLIQTPDGSPFETYFSNNNSTIGIVSFKNLGKDALLVVPCPQGPDSAYVHLASFVREAPENQKHALWQEVGQQVQKELSQNPLWMSTAGGGVNWLHVRMDSKPKYYGYEPYRRS